MQRRESCSAWNLTIFLVCYLVLLAYSIRTRLRRPASANHKGQGGTDSHRQTMCKDATLLAIKRASEHGVCVMGLRRSHHVGRLGTYGEFIAKARQSREFFS